MRHASHLAALVLGTLAFCLLAFVLGGCAGSPEVRQSRRPAAIEALRVAAQLVEAAADVCPAPLEWCPEVRGWSVPLASGLEGTADALERGGSPEDVGVCLAPVVPRFLTALRRSRNEIPPLLVAMLAIAVDYLPDCDVPPDEARGGEA